MQSSGPTSTVRYPCVDISMLPDISQEEMDFYDTSFFQHDPNSLPKLPPPATILEQHPTDGPGVVKLDYLNLAVKFGPSSYLRLEEAQTMRAMRQAFLDNEVPVPEVFGWRKYKDQNFIYMSLVRGKTLREAWPSFAESDKESVCKDLQRIVLSLQRITHNSPNMLIGSINGGTVQDRFFKLDYEKGPFLSIRSFNDWVFTAATRQATVPERFEGSYREFLPDCGNVYFTHGDLTLGNIIVSGMPGFKKIAGIVDWEQAGWYPEYWEYCKMLYGVQYTHEWRSAGWVSKIMQAFEDELIAFAEYSSWRCP